MYRQAPHHRPDHVAEHYKGHALKKRAPVPVRKRKAMSGREMLVWLAIVIGVAIWVAHSGIATTT